MCVNLSLSQFYTCIDIIIAVLYFCFDFIFLTLVSKCNTTILNGQLDQQCSGLTLEKCGYSCNSGFIKNPAIKTITCNSNIEWSARTEELCKGSDYYTYKYMRYCNVLIGQNQLRDYYKTWPLRIDWGWLYKSLYGISNVNNLNTNTYSNQLKNIKSTWMTIIKKNSAFRM